MIDIIYYAHSMIMYDTPHEEKELELLKAFFWQGVIFNPNCRWIQTSQDPMRTCLDVIKSGQITGLAVGTNYGRTISLGVYNELRTAQKLCLPVYEIGLDAVMPFNGFLEMTKDDKKRNWARIF